jgi:hypothetical protein
VGVAVSDQGGIPLFKLLDYPLVVLVLAFVLLMVSMWTGANVLGKFRKLEDSDRDDFNVVLGATLTLLSLLIGFSFSMATSRYDQRKGYEEEEANAIGTEYLRVELLPAANADRARTLLRDYLDQRVRFYTTRDSHEVELINAGTAKLQDELWATVRDPAAANPTPTASLAVAGMNDVLNSQGYTQAAWWNRIPASAWSLMLAIAVCCHLLVGYGTRNSKSQRVIRLAFPMVIAISFFLIADIDSPRSGVIRVQPENLISLAQSLRPH